MTSLYHGPSVTKVTSYIKNSKPAKTTMPNDEVGTVVEIVGLDSEKGRRLNSGLGVIIDDSAMNTQQENTDSEHLPVLIFAIPNSSKILQLNLDAPIIISLHIDNLSKVPNQACNLFKEYASHRAQELIAKCDYKNTMFFIQQYYRRWPDDWFNNMTYANLLREGLGTPNNEKDPQAAWELMIQSEPNAPHDFDGINQHRYDMAICCCAANGEPDEALLWALKIDHTKSADDKHMKEEALDVVRQYARMRAVTDSNHLNPFYQVLKHAAMSVLELKPDHPRAITSVAAAECLTGNHKKGVQLYRQGLETGYFAGEEERDLRESLSVAQMQCKGGVLENYRVISKKDHLVACIHNEFIGKYEYQVSAEGVQSVKILSSDVKMHYVSIPDCDDKTAFGDADFEY